MMYEMDYSELARDDVREITLWYRNEQEGLEFRFLLSLDAAVNSLSKNPVIYQINFGSIRSVLLYRFPYRVYYFIENNRIIISGVIHVNRSPRVIKKRIK